ncbi:hypothetical protein VPH35_074569 [Triticum aestivum]
MVMLLVEKYHPILSLPANASSCLASYACPHLCSSIRVQRAAPARPLRVLPRVAWPLLSRQGGGSFHSRRPLLRALAGGVRKALSQRCKCCPPPPQGQGEGRCLCGSSAARGKDCCVQPT